MTTARCFIGIGSNQAARLNVLEQAARLIASHPASRGLKASPVFENPAVVLDGAPDSWRQPFLNAVIELHWASSAEELFHLLKKTEADLGRMPGPRWAPRVIDLDLLIFADEVLNSPHLSVPHPEMHHRDFVLTPLKHLAPAMVPPLTNRSSVLQLARKLPRQMPLWMGILNLTPDSFSDGGLLEQGRSLQTRLDLFEQNFVHCLDLGAESTRPGAPALTASEEWQRLEPGLSCLRTRYQHRIFRPKISVDTYRAATATRALELGCDLINDVSGLSDPEMINVVKNSGCDYVLMHSLTVPADPSITIQSDDPVVALKRWAEFKIEQLVNGGVPIEQIIFDPGIGFGKTSRQSIEILRRINELLDLPVRLLIGHSRKTFLVHGLVHGNGSPPPARERDPETLALSLRLANQGVDILRVHAADLHHRAFRTLQELQ